jgi:hypothetical protein
MPAPNPLIDKASVARAAASSQSEATAKKMLDIIEPGLSAAPLRPKSQFAEPAIATLDAGVGEASKRLETVTQKIITATGNKYIPTQESGTIAANLSAELADLVGSPAAKAAEKLNKLLNSSGTTINAREVLNTISELKTQIRNTSKRNVASSLDIIQEKMETDLANQIRNVVPKAEADKILAELADGRKLYRNVINLFEAGEDSVEAGIFQPEKFFTNVKKTTAKMSKPLREQTIRQAQEYADSGAAKAPGVMRGTTADLFDQAANNNDAALATIANNAQLAEEMVDRIISTAGGSAKTGAGPTMRITTGTDVSTWVDKHRGLEAAIAKASPAAFDRLAAFTSGNQPSVAAQQLGNIAAKAGKGDPGAITEILTTPGMQPETINPLMASPLGTPENRVALSSLATRAATAPDGKFNPSALRDFFDGLVEEGVMNAPSRANLEAMLSKGQLQTAEQVVPLLKAFDKYLGRVRDPGQPAFIDQFRKAQYAAGAGGAQSANLARDVAGIVPGIGIKAMGNLAYVGAILGIPRMMEAISRLKLPPAAVNQIQDMARQIRYRMDREGKNK